MRRLIAMSVGFALLSGWDAALAADPTAFHLLILPAKPSPATLPEEYAKKAANLRFLSIGQVQAIFQQETQWPEQNRNICLIGIRGERPARGADPTVPLDPVPSGAIALGYKLHHAAGWKVGDAIALRGRKFIVARCEPRRGNEDDRTAWIGLKEAQELLGKEGQINGIVIRNARAASDRLGRLRTDIAELLPQARVHELDTRILAQAEERQRAASVPAEQTRQAEALSWWEICAAALVSVGMIGMAMWLGFRRFRRSRVPT